MPRYFFHIIDGGDRLDDPEGVDLADLDTARAEAILTAREIMAEGIKRGDYPDGQIFEITNGDGQILLTIPFKQAIARN
jgi:hypothetical protein